MEDKQDQPLVTTQRDTELSDKDTEEHQKDSQLRKQACLSLSVQTKEERRVNNKDYFFEYK